MSDYLIRFVKSPNNVSLTVKLAPPNTSILSLFMTLCKDDSLLLFSPIFYNIPNVLLNRQDWTKQCWDMGTNLPLLNINSGQSEENNCVGMNAECG